MTSFGQFINPEAIVIGFVYVSDLTLFPYFNIIIICLCIHHSYVYYLLCYM